MARNLNNKFASNRKRALIKKLFLLLPMCVVMMACDNHETQYTYYDDAKSVVKEMYEVDKSTGKKDGDYKRYNQKGVVIYTAKYVNDELQRNYFTDKRDGRKYKVTTIGNQTWMGENLAYETDDSYCYDDDQKNCEKYGRLYEWNAAVNACPEGWGLPGDADFKELIENAGIESLKSKSGWKRELGITDSREVKRKKTAAGHGIDGSDDFDFTVLPTGIKRGIDYLGIGNNYIENGYDGNAYFWKRIENLDKDSLYSLDITFTNSRLKGKHRGLSIKDIKYHDEKEARSIRCLKSNGEKNESIKEMKDSRDGKTYRIITIGNQTWMAENLNFATGVCYNDSLSNCEKYGRLYGWESAQKACPDGWHLPSKKEFEKLLMEVGRKEIEEKSARDYAQGYNNFLREMGLPEEKFDDISEDSVITYIHWIDAGLSLKSTSGWNKGNGADAYGFAAIPAGRANFEELGTTWVALGEESFFWSSTRGENPNEFYCMKLSFSSNEAYLSNSTFMGSYDAYSVRCVKD